MLLETLSQWSSMPRPIYLIEVCWEELNTDEKWIRLRNIQTTSCFKVDCVKGRRRYIQRHKGSGMVSSGCQHDSSLLQHIWMDSFCGPTQVRSSFFYNTISLFKLFCSDSEFLRFGMAESEEQAEGIIWKNMIRQTKRKNDTRSRTN